MLVDAAKTNRLLYSELFYVDNFYLLRLGYLEPNCLTNLDLVAVLVIVILDCLNCHDVIFKRNILDHNVQDFFSYQISHIVSAEVIYYPTKQATLVSKNHRYIC